MDDLLADFVAETREMLEASGGEIVAWEADPTDKVRLDTIFRFVHTVKGNCGFFDFPRLEKLSHAAEDALADCRAGRREPDAALVSAVLAIIDRISEMTDSIEAGEELSDGGDDELIAALQPGEPPAAEACEAPGSPSRQTTSDAGEDDVAPKPNRSTTVQRSIRLPTELLDEVMKGVSDMVLARNDLARRLREAGEQPTIDGPFDRLSTILADVRSAITRMRMQRLEHLFASLPRLVRDLSNELGKQVTVEFEGGEVELDREMVEMVRDPLTHIIRNALDHGLEGPGERIKADKHETGLLKFAARQAGNQITLVISDDGRGIDTARLAAKAVAAGIYSQSEIDEMSEHRRLYLIFEPGLSTADAVSAVSGRGVGMDVVRANIERVGGSIDVTSKPGEGTSFHLKLPLTLSIIAALTVGSGGQRYAIPRSYVEEIVFGSSDHVEFAQAGERRLVTFRGMRVPCLALGEILGTETNAEVVWESKTLVLVRLASNDVFALAVDRVFDHEDVVVKPIAPAIVETGFYAGTTLLDDGRPMMLLDLPSIAQKHQLANEMRGATRVVEDDTVEEHKTHPIMLFTGLDGRRRAVRLDLVRRIDTIARDAIDIEGTRTQAVIDGEIFSLVGLEYGELPEERCRLLRLSDGDCEVVYAVREVLDAAEMDGEIVPSSADPHVEGVALIGGQPVPVIDGHALFASGRKPNAHGRPVSCRLPSDSDWARTILEPLVAAAGYKVSTDKDEETDVAIELVESETPLAARARHVIRLRSDPEADGSGNDSIYRYDREGLLDALKQARMGKTA
ncbi:chemotaxis protein CheW [Erythrobacter sp.]|uniref:chemotaxis protein CheA n=1 Tax=Erythrobacter sp. TaxID=1042 RepID=UPI001B05F614|nr:chemotaxis protein CheW [Erythrobacter sp.]MBO6525589.1 chemotaxis protein CheW [Erythrobacter sp.]MBO6529738.1 chemotaxis protein CheW [Erythrobacter sp.]